MQNKQNNHVKYDMFGFRIAVLGNFQTNCDISELTQIEQFLSPIARDTGSVLKVFFIV